MGYAVEEVDIPFANLQAKNPDIKRFSASTIIFCRDPHNPTEPYAFLCQRAHWDHSLGKANSWAGSWETPGGSHDHGESILDTAIRETREEAIKLNPDEHMDFCWATEAQIRDSLPYDAEKPQQEGLVMLENKKKTILDAFKQLQDSQLDMIVRSGEPRE
ncbi:hypothetical protein NUU61_001504 [Penicillium alfredii]|uniref:Nudix hydrolase domain-containing protein n=1 Tax=Penicillium alfredii TaxID=1506179 RepID=A0A9W9G4H3_9EURO|nr:uncharacterized protein NUU61_001504 [Penicillium alfredii]KAJ5111874.1 hypothetical protein NUU61_001504 [Penicillium alfredii]